MSVLKSGLKNVAGQFHLKGILVADGIDFVIHVEHFAFVERERFADVMERVRVDRFLKRLAQQILPRFGIGDVLEDGEHDVVADETFRRAEKAEIAHDDLAFIGGELVGFPKLDVLLHRHFGGHPVIRAAVEIMFPRPFIFERHELVHVHGAAIQQPLVFGVDALGRDREPVGTFSGGIAAGHIYVGLLVYVWKNDHARAHVLARRRSVRRTSSLMDDVVNGMVKSG